MTKYSYWKMTHKYSPRDCNIEASARRQNKRDMTMPIPRGFSKPWNGPLYDAPDVVGQIEARKLPKGATIGMNSPAVDLSGNFDSMGNLPWEKFLTTEKAEKRRKGVISLVGLKIVPWDQLTFAERKLKIKQQVAEKEAERKARKLRQLRGEESSSSESSDDSDDDAFARSSKKKAKKAGKLQKPRGFTMYDPFAKKAAELSQKAAMGEVDENESDILEEARRARRLRNVSIDTGSMSRGAKQCY
jgi:hypothetical protein